MLYLTSFHMNSDKRFLSDLNSNNFTIKRHLAYPEDIHE